MVAPPSLTPRTHGAHSASNDLRPTQSSVAKHAGAFLAGGASVACADSTIWPMKSSKLGWRPEELKLCTGTDLAKTTRATPSSPALRKPRSPTLQAAAGTMIATKVEGGDSVALPALDDHQGQSAASAAARKNRKESPTGQSSGKPMSRRLSRSSTQASSSSSTGRRTPSPGSSSVQSRCGFVSTSDPDDRCGCVTKDDFWTLFDAFDAMDRFGMGAITRADFFWALKALGTCAEFQRAVNKARVAVHFHNTAGELSFEAFIHRAFPTATEMDIICMLRWSNLRKAYNIVTNASFAATEDDLRQVFGLLDEGKRGHVTVVEMLSAHLFSQAEVDAALPPQKCPFNLEFDAFCGLVLSKYWLDGQAGIKDEDIRTGVWRDSVKRSFEKFRQPEVPVDNSRSSISDSRNTISTDAETVFNYCATTTPVPPSAPRPQTFRRAVTVR